MIIEPCKYCGEIEHSKLSALTHVCDKEVLRERITAQHSMLMRIYENAQDFGGTTPETATAWQIDTVDYLALENFLYPESANEEVIASGPRCLECQRPLTANDPPETDKCRACYGDYER